MSEELYSTSDIWLGALLLCETDAQLDDIQINNNGRETVFFSFRGKDLAPLAKSYCRNEALANVTLLRKKINDLRDLIFQAKRKK